MFLIIWIHRLSSRNSKRSNLGRRGGRIEEGEEDNFASKCIGSSISIPRRGGKWNAQPMLTYLHGGWPTLPRKKLAGRAKRSANSPRLIRRITSSYQGTLIQLPCSRRHTKCNRLTFPSSASPRFPSRILLVRAVIYPPPPISDELENHEATDLSRHFSRPEKLILLLRSCFSCRLVSHLSWMMVVGDQGRGY